MSRLTRDGTVEPVSGGTILSGANGDMKKFVFPIQLTTGRIGNHTRLIYFLLKVLIIHSLHISL